MITLEPQHIVAALTGSTIVGTIAGFVVKEGWGIFRTRMANGNGKSPTVEVNVGKEANALASTSGKSFCDYHIKMMQDVVDVKGGVKLLNQITAKMDRDVAGITAAQVDSRRILDSICDHFQIRTWK